MAGWWSESRDRDYKLSMLLLKPNRCCLSHAMKCTIFTNYSSNQNSVLIYFLLPVVTNQLLHTLKFQSKHCSYQIIKYSTTSSCESALTHPIGIQERKNLQAIKSSIIKFCDKKAKTLSTFLLVWIILHSRYFFSKEVSFSKLNCSGPEH